MYLIASELFGFYTGAVLLNMLFGVTLLAILLLPFGVQFIRGV